MNWIIWIIYGIIMAGFVVGVYRGALRIAVSIVTAIVTIFIIFGLVAIPSQIFTNTYAWVSGFTNYVLGTVMSFIFIVYCSY